MNTVSLSARIKCAFVLIILTIAGLGPFPVTSAVGLFIVIFRPRWFKNLVDSIYAE